MRWIAVLAALSIQLTGCGDDEKGFVSLQLYGEEFIESGIASEQVEDRWAIEFSRFDVEIPQVVLSEAQLQMQEAVDLTRPSFGEGQQLGILELEEASYSNAQFVLGTVEVEGNAEKEGVKKQFSWRFEQRFLYSDCEHTTDVRSDADSTLEITIHADHLLFDSLVSSHPSLRFEGIAQADQNMDGEVSESELKAADLGNYDPGSSGEINTLWEYLAAQVSLLGHVDGEGHCRVQPSP